VRHSFAEATVQDKGEGDNQGDKLTDVSEGDAISNEPLFTFEVCVKNFDLFFDSFDCVVELFGVVSVAENVVSNFGGVRPVASDSDQGPHVDLSLSKLG
jgi:hypothetical protein